MVYNKSSIFAQENNIQALTSTTDAITNEQDIRLSNEQGVEALSS